MRNRSCPAVSQIVSFTVFPPSVTVFTRKSTPIVDLQVDEKTSSTGASAVPAKKEADRQVAVAIGNLNDEMTFSEFTEGLAAIAVYKDPDPYLPLHQKLESFLVNSVFGKLTTDKSSSQPKSSSSKTPAAKNLSSADVETKAEVAGNSEPSIDADGVAMNEGKTES